MKSISDHVEFVNQQMEFQLKMADKYAKTPYRQKLHSGAAENLKELKEFLLSTPSKIILAEERGRQLPVVQQLNLFPNELDGLPDELLKELSISEADKTEHAILALLEEAGGIISLDRILVGLYKKTGDIHKRVTMTSRMYRMSQKGYVFPVPGKKGAYSTTKLTEDDAAKIFATPDDGPDLV